MEENNVFSSSYNYNNFPSYICVSVSNKEESELTHGIPTNIPFEKGDLVSVDVACYSKNKNNVSFHADAALTVIVEEKENKEKIKLLQVTKNCLNYVITQITPKKTTVRDIGIMIQQYIESRGFYSIREYGGHCIGNELHETPFIPNHRYSNDKTKIEPGMFICIESLVQVKDNKITKKIKNNWEVIISTNNFINAHFEHTIYIEDNKAIILTGHDY